MKPPGGHSRSTAGRGTVETMRIRRGRQWAVAAALAAGCGCGSSGDMTGASGASAAGTTAPAQYTPGVFPSRASLAAQCQTPRTGTDPATGRAYPDKPGSTVIENEWLRSWTHELYLWYREVPDVNPTGYSTADYFNLLKTTATTATGQPKDKFHFTYTTAQWQALSQSGIDLGYGAQWVVLASRPPRQVVVAYTDPNTPAAAAGIARGAQVLTVDGADLVNAGDQASVDKLNAGLFPTAAGPHTFSILDLGASAPRTVTMNAAQVASTPVQNVGTIASGGNVGYMLFNDHLAQSEDQLISAFTQLAAAGVSDLVLDIRYNGGGYLDIANEVAYMIAGPGPTAGKTFEKTIFNDQYSSTDPVTGQALAPDPFLTSSQGFSGAKGRPLPTLNLSRVFVLTSSNTCSASESIINGLRGVDVQVIQVGGTTCGKPYGFYPEDNCGTTYFSIEFQGVNAKNFGDYPDGFSPTNATGTVGVTIPGCAVADDFTHALGDPREARLSAALGYRGNQSCPAASASVTGSVAPGLAAADGLA